MCPVAAAAAPETLPFPTRGSAVSCARHARANRNVTAMVRIAVMFPFGHTRRPIENEQNEWIIGTDKLGGSKSAVQQYGKTPDHDKLDAAQNFLTCALQPRHRPFSLQSSQPKQRDFSP